MTYNNRPTFKNLFELEEIVTVKKSYRRKYTINWRQLFLNIKYMIMFWKPRERKQTYHRIIIPNTLKDTIAEMDRSLIQSVVKNSEN